MSSVVVRAPATSANLGAGFDCLGMALGLWNEVTATPGSEVDGSNLILRAARATYDRLGVTYPGFTLSCTNRIVFSRGLGSSAAAIVCGVLIANQCLGNPLGVAAMLEIATGLEGHPDNVAPCLLGGVRVVVRVEDGTVLQAPVLLPLGLNAVCFVPELGVPTPDARGLLPPSVSLSDAVFNMSRSSLMVAALASGKLDLIAEATRDRLHQRYRLPLFPAGATLLEAAMQAGALGAFISGAGPTVMALCANGEAAGVARAFESTAGECAVAGTSLVLEVTEQGAHVVA